MARKDSKTAPYSICADPRNAQSYWVGDSSSIRYCDGKTITLLAGGEERSYQDGTGENARFWDVEGMVCTQNGDKLFVTDCLNHRIRMVDTKTGEVKTIAGNGKSESKDGNGLDAGMDRPRKVVFYRSPTAKPNSVLYFTSAGGVRRFDIETGFVSTLTLKSSAVGYPCGIDCTSSGHLIVSCITTHSIYLIDPSKGDITLMVGSGECDLPAFADGIGQSARFNLAVGLVLVDSKQCIYVTDRDNNRIRRVALPTQLFSVASGGPKQVGLSRRIVPAADDDSKHHKSNEASVLASAKPGSDVKSLSVNVAEDDPTSAASAAPTSVIDSLQRASPHAETNRQNDTLASVDAKKAVGDPAVAGDAAVEIKQIQSDIKSVWNEVIRLSNEPRSIVSGAVGSNAATIKGTN